VIEHDLDFVGTLCAPIHVMAGAGSDVRHDGRDPRQHGGAGGLSRHDAGSRPGSFAMSLLVVEQAVGGYGDPTS
jgi:hypothetical protein